VLAEALQSTSRLVDLHTSSQPNAEAVFRVQETLSKEILGKMDALTKPDYSVFTLDDVANYDAFVFGIPTRFGNMPAQWKVGLTPCKALHKYLICSHQAFWDHTSKEWAKGGFHGKYASMFVSTASPGGGQEMTPLTMMSTLTHHGMIYVPLGYYHTFAQLTNVNVAHGGMFHR